MRSALLCIVAKAASTDANPSGDDEAILSQRRGGSSDLGPESYGGELLDCVKDATCIRYKEISMRQKRIRNVLMWKVDSNQIKVIVIDDWKVALTKLLKTCQK